MDKQDFWRHFNKLYQTNGILTNLYTEQLSKEGRLQTYQVEVIREFFPGFGDLRWLNDDLLSLYADFEFAGIHFEELKFSPSEKINLSNIHLNVIDVVDFLKLKLFALFAEVHDFLQYNKVFERTQDLQDIKTIVQLDDIDCKELLNKLTNYMQDSRCRNLTSALLDAYLAQTLSNAQINEFLKENRFTSYA
jgi:hypothetical protein